MPGQLLIDLLKVRVPGRSILWIDLLADMPLLVIDQRPNLLDLPRIGNLLVLQQGGQEDIGRKFTVA